MLATVAGPEAELRMEVGDVVNNLDVDAAPRNVIPLPVKEPVATPAVEADNRRANAREHWGRFIAGTCNQLAWTTANMVVSDPGRMTPVLFHGPCGVGKSHLLAAVRAAVAHTMSYATRRAYDQRAIHERLYRSDQRRRFADVSVASIATSKR